jgi:hypothetical protein
MAVKKTAPKKTAAPTGVKVVLELARETKNTYRFETDVEDAVINPLYVQKSAFSGEAPQSITVTVTPN